jgi:hypothetical protein
VSSQHRELQSQRREIEQLKAQQPE